MRLERQIIKQNWTKVNSLLKTKRGQKELVVLSNRESWVTPLVLVIIKKAPVKILQKILEIEPSLSIRRDNSGMSPLHLACNSGSPLEVILLLLQYYCRSGTCPSMSSEHVPVLQDFRLMTPLHHLLTYICFPFHAKLDNKTSSNAVHNSTTYSFQLTRGESVPRTAIEPISSSAGEDDHHPSAGMFADDGKNGNIFNMTLSQEEFEKCLVAVDEILNHQPESMSLCDRHGRFPIDILHDFVACNRPDDKSINVERARLLCKKLRKLSVKIYMSEKARCEEQREVDRTQVHTTESTTVSTDDTNCAHHGSIAASSAAGTLATWIG